MSREWLWWISEFGLVVVVAVVAGFVTKDVPISILYGLFVGTVFFVLREHRRVVAHQERQVSEIAEMVAKQEFCKQENTEKQHDKKSR